MQTGSVAFWELSLNICSFFQVTLLAEYLSTHDKESVFQSLTQQIVAMRLSTGYCYRAASGLLP